MNKTATPKTTKRMASMDVEICYLDATELAARIRSKRLSPVEAARAFLARIEAVNPRLNAIVTPMDGAIEDASRAEAALMRGDEVGPLHGVPITIKDCFNTAGTRTTRGSRLFADHVPSSDATAVRRLKAAGAIVVGKTNLPEFALGWETDNLLFGRTRNPWNLDRITGGSSGGEAAALAAGLSALGLGSDAGGSIRMPAHCCGVVGLKPTYGRVPLTGAWPETLLRVMHVGPLARSVRDVALALQILAGPDGHDPFAVPVPSPAIPDTTFRFPPLRIGWTETGGAAPVDREVRATVAAAAAKLAELGFRTEPVVIPELEGRDWQAISMILYAAECRPYFRPIIAGREQELHPSIRRRLAFPVDTLDEYLQAAAEWDRLRFDVANYFTKYDLLLCPTSALPAHCHGLIELDVDGQTVPARHSLRAAIPWDLTGSPALSLPFGWSGDGLPIGVQIVGRHFDETLLLGVGMLLEATTDAGRRQPPIY